MKTLENAFAHAKAARSIVRPNVAFLRQLADYEAQLHGEANCSPWLEHTHNGVTKRLPEFILKRFFDDYQNEFEVSGLGAPGGYNDVLNTSFMFFFSLQ